MPEYYVHNIDPFIFHFPEFMQIGPLKGVPWYGFSYLVGFIVAFYLMEKLRKDTFFPLKSREETENFVSYYLVFGVIIGGRLGHIIFYQPEIFFDNPLNVFAVWQGGMASHGGILGVILAIYLYAKRKGYEVFRLLDSVAMSTIPGLGFGRIANFINGEYAGHVTDVSWAVIFPKTFDNLPRHPAQLYQALGEGLFMFIVLWFILPRNRFKAGFHFAAFFVFYGLQRIVTEMFRETSVELESMFSFLTQGQLLSVLMILFGIWLFIYTQYQRGSSAKTA